MINLSLLNRSIIIVIISTLFFNSAEATEPVDIWKENQEEQKEINKQGPDIEQKNTNLFITNDNLNNLPIIEEEQSEEFINNLVGLFDPEVNDLSLDLWSKSDGSEIKKILLRINNLELSKFSEDLFFKVLFTNAYAPKNNFNNDEFLNFKIQWLIKEGRIKDLENLLNQNPIVGKNKKAIRYLLEEYLSSANIKLACEKAKLIHKDLENNYLEKFNIYCLIHEDRKDEAILILDLLKEKGFKDDFFENKINFLLGYSSQTNEKILDDSLVNFYLSQITSANFNYKPHDKTSKYIWRYMSSANLLNTEDMEQLDNEKTILLFEQAASNDSFDKREIFDIYEKFLFNVNQFLNVKEVYKTLPKYKARALIYQSILLTDNIEKKLYLIFLLKDLFEEDKILHTYSDQLVFFLEDIKFEEIPKNYLSIVEQHIKKKKIISKKIKFNNKIIHQSKLLKYFLEDQTEKEKIQKDINSVYKKIKKNKKYFVSIKDIILLESLEDDGFNLPKDSDFTDLSEKLSIPQGLNELAKNKQTGLVILKIVEIIGEDKIVDLDPESIYFLSKILNELNLKKIRNDILLESLPGRV